MFDNCGDVLSDLIESVQFRAARTCTGAFISTNKDKLMVEVGWETLKSRRLCHKYIQFYKVKNGLTPAYLQNLCPPTVAHVTNYNLRNKANCRPPANRTNRYKNSFIPSVSNLWNDLDHEIKNSASLEIFKNSLKKTTIPNAPPSYYKIGHRFAVIQHTRLRLNASPLKYHLFRKNIILSAECQCGHPREDSKHYLLACPVYTNQRKEMLQLATNILAPGLNPNLMIHIASDRLITILLEGTPELDIDTNVLLFKSVQNFILHSKRFIV